MCTKVACAGTELRSSRRSSKPLQGFLSTGCLLDSRGIRQLRCRLGAGPVFRVPCTISSRSLRRQLAQLGAGPGTRRSRVCPRRVFREAWGPTTRPWAGSDMARILPECGWRIQYTAFVSITCLPRQVSEKTCVLLWSTRIYHGSVSRSPGHETPPWLRSPEQDPTPRVLTLQAVASRLPRPLLHRGVTAIVPLRRR